MFIIYIYTGRYSSHDRTPQGVKKKAFFIKGEEKRSDLILFFQNKERCEVKWVILPLKCQNKAI